MPDTTGKTEKPTQKRLRDGQKEGQFPRTPDAPTWIAIAAGAAVIPWSVREAGERAREMLRHLPVLADDPSPARALRIVADLPVAVLWGAGPVCAAAMIGALLGAAAQGVHPSGKALAPKWSRLNPLQGIKRMFGLRAAWEGLKATLKVALIGAVVVVLGIDMVEQLIGAGPMPLGVTVERARKGLELTIWASVAAGVVLALADYAYQRYEVMKQLMMSPKEIKDETKQTEGDPQVKGAIRAKQMAMSRNRMLAAVAQADVVLVNPTHIAVALSYEAGRGAPRVVAKGAGAIAGKIREKAREHRVPVVEDKPLARGLYRICELGDEVPAELYVAVARILAFVMTAGRPGRTAGVRRPTGPQAPLPELPTRTALRVRRAREIRAARAK